MSELTKQFDCGSVIGAGRLLFGEELSKFYPFSFMGNRSYPALCSIRATQIHSFVFVLAVIFLATIPPILRSGTDPEISFSIIQCLMVYMVNVTIREFHDLPAHVDTGSPNGSVLSFTRTNDGPIKPHQILVHIRINNGHLSTGESYKPTRVSLYRDYFCAHFSPVGFYKTLMAYLCTLFFVVAAAGAWFIPAWSLPIEKENRFTIALRLGTSFQRRHGLTPDEIVRLDRTSSSIHARMVDYAYL